MSEKLHLRGVKTVINAIKAIETTMKMNNFYLEGGIIEFLINYLLANADDIAHLRYDED